MLGSGRGIDWLYLNSCFRGKSKAGRRQREEEVKHTAFARRKRSSCRAVYYVMCCN